MDAETLIKRLEKYPYLKSRIEGMLEVAENASGTWEIADDVEEKICDEISKMGIELLTTWAYEQEIKKSLESQKHTKHSKKNFTGTQP